MAAVAALADRAHGQVRPEIGCISDTELAAGAAERTEGAAHNGVLYTPQ